MNMASNSPRSGRTACRMSAVKRKSRSCGSALDGMNGGCSVTSDGTTRRLPEDVLSELLSGFEVTQAIHVAAKLGIVDVIADGAKTAEEIAAMVGAHPPALYRLLRALTTLDILHEDSDGRFVVTDLGTLLRVDHPESFRPDAILLGDAIVWRPWGELYHAVVTGTPSFDAVFGEPFFTHLAHHPEASSVFNAAMTSVSSEMLPAILAAYDFSDLSTIVDVGGGEGELLRGILTAYPQLSGVLFDLPNVVAQADTVRTAAATRIDIVGGDMFAAVPPGGDVYLLMRILHDWSDDAAVTILERCRQAMAPNGRVLVVERLLDPTKASESATWVDLNMLVLVGGRERSEQDFHDLFAAAGFACTRVLPAGGLFIIEGTPHQ